MIDKKANKDLIVEVYRRERDGYDEIVGSVMLRNEHNVFKKIGEIKATELFPAELNQVTKSSDGPRIKTADQKGRPDHLERLSFLLDSVTDREAFCPNSPKWPNFYRPEFFEAMDQMSFCRSIGYVHDVKLDRAFNHLGLDVLRELVRRLFFSCNGVVVEPVLFDTLRTNSVRSKRAEIEQFEIKTIFDTESGWRSLYVIDLSGVKRLAKVAQDQSVGQ